MTNGRGSLSIRTYRDANGYILIPCRVEPLYEFDLVLHTGRPYSYLSLRVARTLGAFGYLEALADRLYRLHEVEMDGQQIPDIITRVSLGPRLLGFDGFLGLHFLDLFSHIHFARDAGVLDLAY